MNKDIIGECSFCGKVGIPVASTSQVGPYCKECLEITILECKGALSEIKKSTSKKTNKKKTITSEELLELEKQKDEALEKLMNFGRKE